VVVLVDTARGKRLEPGVGEEAAKVVLAADLGLVEGAGRDGKVVVPIVFCAGAVAAARHVSMEVVVVLRARYE
jgi:hypothetical protein